MKNQFTALGSISFKSADPISRKKLVTNTRYPGLLTIMFSSISEVWRIKSYEVVLHNEPLDSLVIIIVISVFSIMKIQEYFYFKRKNHPLLTWSSESTTELLKKELYGPFFIDGVQLSRGYRATTRR